jgi:hypothetical protein
MSNDEDDEPWPLPCIIERCSTSPQRDAPRVVLLSTGALNPVHIGHLNAMHRARAYLSLLGFHVLAGFLSPTHDNYVRPKMLHQVPRS